MGFISFVGRVFFASVFLLSAYQEFVEFGEDGGPALKALRPKYDALSNNVMVHTGVKLPEFELKHVIATAIVLKGFGGLLFILSSYVGAFLLAIYLAFSTPVLYDFYNYPPESSEYGQLFSKFILNSAFLGAVCFFWGMKNSITMRLQKKSPKSKTL
ncbi:hypothetical protein LUZ61_018527 [Rhynchospora tenuis]|uniref:Uncharacterized protein n=1 Tax=Rhynchospora tenuis TaxID=198213 RepID=A0AAD5Z9H2_9POAL|nr:hypothetical protein LUZ61_018527 [Rhynchospora tenuis]